MPIRSSSRTSIPSERKRTQSVSISATLQLAKKVNKTKNTDKRKKKLVSPLSSPPPALPLAQPKKPIFVGEDEDIEEVVEVEDEDAGILPPLLARFTSV